MDLVSFDIDGTTTFGDPPGVVDPQAIRAVRELGCLVGSASDRTETDQRRLWEQNGLTPDFVVLKHNLANLKGLFPADQYWHVGDGAMDATFAASAGFTFILVDLFYDQMPNLGRGPQ